MMSAQKNKFADSVLNSKKKSSGGQVNSLRLSGVYHVSAAEKASY